MRQLRVFSLASAALIVAGCFGGCGGGGEGAGLCDHYVRAAAAGAGDFLQQFHAAVLRGADCHEFTHPGDGGRHY